MLLVGCDRAFREHDTGAGHPERPARLDAVDRGIEDSRLGEGIVAIEGRDATRAELELVHDPAYLDGLEARCETGRPLDPDTHVSPGSWHAALRAAGIGPAAVERLDAGDAQAAFLAVRPPGHHALPDRAMGFCLLNNVAVTAATLAERGERVAIVDYDAHHGNGTQAAFVEDPRVLYVSFHQWPLYPGTGRSDEQGAGSGRGWTCNIPVPAGTTGDVYLGALDEIVAPLLDRFAPTWLLISAGFDAHRDDPLTGLGLSAGDFGLVTRRLVAQAPPGRVMAFLEGGYDLDAVRHSVAAVLPALVGRPPTAEPVGGAADEKPTSGGPGRPVVDALAPMWRSPRG